MRIHLVNGQNMFRLQMQSPLSQRIAGQMQNSGFKKIIQQVNAYYGSKRSHDTVELSKKSLDLLNVSKTKKTDETEKPEAAADYQKYSAGITKEQWAENALSEQRNGIKTASDIIDHAKSKLKYTMSKIHELEEYLNGTGTHSDPNMTKELAETYLHNYKHSIQTDYTDILQSHIHPHQSAVDEYDELSGGLASKVIGNQLDSITAESLGLSNFSGDPQEIMEALENASKILNGMNQKVESAYADMTGGKVFTEHASSTSIFDGNSSLNFFASQMERSHRIVDTPLKFNGQTLNLRGYF